MNDSITNVNQAFDYFKTQFLKGKKSIFNDNENVLNENAVKYLEDNFINNGYGGDETFIKKIKHQLITKPKEEKSDDIQKQAIEILATAYWLWRLVPANSKMESTQKGVQEILGLYLGCIPNTNKKVFDNNIKGIASVGTYYNTNKPFELAYIIHFFSEYIKNDKTKKSEIEILKEIVFGENQETGKMRIVSAKNNNKTQDLNKGSGKLTNAENESKTFEHVKSVSIYNALLYFFDPKKYEAIISQDHKNRIVNALEHMLDDSNEKLSIDEKIEKIKGKLVEELKLKDDFSFYHEDIEELWNPTILPSKNVIYHGAPGTGKTYGLKKLVERKTKNVKSRYKIVQFHPSYNYEDFIDGLKPVGNNSGSIQIELVNGIFKEMCIEAFKELENAKTEERKPKTYYFIADEINRAELSRVFGELLLCLEEDKRIRFDDEGKLQGELIKTQNSSLWKEKHAVYKKGDELYFGVPENIYFLGTMNDIDRSIDSFDLALRRRFKWVHKSCDYDVIANELIQNGAIDETIVEYLSDGKDTGIPKGRCLLLNEYISDKLNLGTAFELGHSYYMKVKIRDGKISASAYESLFDFELGPLLKEYLRAEYSDGKELESKLKEMRKLFTTGKIK